jgi:polyhydroxyalkanoate synthesis regulator phasin
MALTDREKYILYNALLVQSGIYSGETKEHINELIDTMVKLKIPKMSEAEIKKIVAEIKDEVGESIDRLSGMKTNMMPKSKPKFFNMEN